MRFTISGFDGRAGGRVKLGFCESFYGREGRRRRRGWGKAVFFPQGAVQPLPSKEGTTLNVFMDVGLKAKARV